MRLLFYAWVVFTYVPADKYEDGSELLLNDIDLTKIYCGSLIRAEQGADGVIGIQLPSGNYTCYGTHVVNGVESKPSENVTIVVPSAPNALTNLEVK